AYRNRRAIPVINLFVQRFRFFSIDRQHRREPVRNVLYLWHERYFSGHIGFQSSGYCHLPLPALPWIQFAGRARGRHRVVSTSTFVGVWRKRMSSSLRTVKGLDALRRFRLLHLLLLSFALLCVSS